MEVGDVGDEGKVWIRVMGVAREDREEEERVSTLAFAPEFRVRPSGQNSPSS